jgi:hypothetical protein
VPRVLTRPAAAALVAAGAVFAAISGLAGCSGSGESVAPSSSSVDAIGNPTDTASPIDTARPRPTDQVAVAVAGSTPTGSAALDPGIAALGSCLNGNWAAPVAREFSSLGMSQRTKGAVRSGTGVLRITFGRDQTFTFRYEQVTLSLTAGQAVVSGPVTGTWSLQGNTLKTVLGSSQTKVDVKVGPITVAAPASVASVVETLPPSDVLITCTANQLTMQLPASDGGGTVRFDRA